MNPSYIRLFDCHATHTAAVTVKCAGEGSRKPCGKSQKYRPLPRLPARRISPMTAGHLSRILTHLSVPETRPAMTAGRDGKEQ